MDQATWAIIISVIAALAACGSFIYAYSSAKVAKSALQITQQQEARRQPSFKPFLMEGFYKKSSDSKVYAFSVSLSNPTDIDNSIAQIELEISYVTANNVCMKLKIFHQSNLAKDFGEGPIQPFNVPLPILSHQTVAGWMLFNVSNALLGECKIDSYLIRILDAHGLLTIMEPNLVKEFINV